MATVTDVEVANASFPNVRQDLNDILEAIATNFSADAEPTTTYPNQWWYETDTDKLYIRNEDNDAWIHVLTLDQTTDTVSSVQGVTADAISEGNSSVEVIDTGTGYIQINVDGSEAARFDSSGNLLVGKTSSSESSVGVELKPSSAIVTRNNDAPLKLRRNTSDGDILQLAKDGTTVGSIGTSTGNIYIQGGTDKTGIEFRGNAVYPRDNGSLTDGANDLGGSSNRWSDLYLSGGVYLGGTGAANKLDDYEEGTFTATFADESSGGNTSTTASIAEYVKVGDMVNLVIHMSGIDTTGLTSGNPIFIQGMPFNSKQANWGSARLSGISFSGFVTAQIQGDYIRLRENISGSSNFMTISDVTDDDGQIYLTVTYRIS